MTTVSEPLEPTATLDDVIPRPDFRSRHERRVDAPPERVWDALVTTGIDRHPVVRLFVGARFLPVRIRSRRRPAPRPPGRTLVDSVPYPLVSVAPGRGAIMAGVGKPWRLDGAWPPPRLDLAGVRAFDEPGWVRLAMEVRVAAAGAGPTLSTETRVVATDDSARRRFGAYWQLIRVPSSIIRRIMLDSVATVATQGHQVQRSAT